MLDQIYMKIWDMSWSAGIVILTVLFLRLILRRAPKKYSYLLWAAVLFRLLWPMIPEVSFGIIPRFDSLSTHYTLEEESISVGGASLAAYRAIGDALNGGLGVQHIRTSLETADGMTHYVSAGWWEVWILIGQYIWLAGLVVQLVGAGVRFYRLRQKLSEAVLLRKNVYAADGIDTPFVYGVLHPRIYLPAALPETLWDSVILHEEAHIRRGDPFWKLLAYLARCIHWMNPLVWLAFRLAEQDMEMSCDEAVLDRLPAERHADYAESLLLFVSRRRTAMPIPPAFGEGNVKGRIKNMANRKTPKKWVTVFSTILCVLLLVACSADAKQETQDTAQEETVTATQPTDQIVPESGAADADQYAEDLAELREEIEIREQKVEELTAVITCRDPSCDDLAHHHEVRVKMIVAPQTSHHSESHCSHDHH